MFKILYRRGGEGRLKEMVPRIPRIYSVPNLFVNAILICYFTSKYVNLLAVSSDLICVCRL